MNNVKDIIFEEFSNLSYKNDLEHKQLEEQYFLITEEVKSKLNDYELFCKFEKINDELNIFYQQKLIEFVIEFYKNLFFNK